MLWSVLDRKTSLFLDSSFLFTTTPPHLNKFHHYTIERRSLIYSEQTREKGVKTRTAFNFSAANKSSHRMLEKKLTFGIHNTTNCTDICIKKRRQGWPISLTFSSTFQDFSRQYFGIQKSLRKKKSYFLDQYQGLIILFLQA